LPRMACIQFLQEKKICYWPNSAVGSVCEPLIGSSPG
jgi:hypothetical protein